MKKILAISIAGLLLFLFWLPAQADVAPPQKPSGSSLGSEDESTQVQMLAEEVTINVLASERPQAHVTANFTMRNTGSNTESMEVRFPLGQSDGWGEFPEIRNFGVKVNDKAVSYERKLQLDQAFSRETSYWAVFPVTFMPAEDVYIKVSYDLDGTGYEAESKTSFYYVLSTGAGWKGTIGSARISLSLPYEANPYNVILHEEFNDVRFDGNEAQWLLDDFEPSRANDFIFPIVKPSVWQRLITEKERVAGNPKDGEAWGRLGKTYKEVCFASDKGYPRMDAASSELYELSKEAYSKSVALLPDDALWHAGYAELLLKYNLWNWNGEINTDDLTLGYRELEQAYELSPEDPFIIEQAQLFADEQDDGTFIFQNPNQAQPEPAPTMLPQEETEAPAETSAPATAAEKPTKQANETGGKAPMCGGAAFLFPFALAVWLRLKR
ncbi:MAG: hypothetical protein JXA13_06780 [Anaerolineales bacterium]|nr:hypothetical protein [Anaerolineales bacterium]